MKKLLLGVLAMMIATMITAQKLPVDAKTGKVTFMKVIETGNVTAAEAKIVLQKWAAKQTTFSVTSDEATKLFYKGRHKVNYPAPKGSINQSGDVSFNLQFFFKDGKFRYIMTDFIHSGKYGAGGKMVNVDPKCGYGKIKEKSWNMIKNQTLTKSTKMVEEFTKALQEFQNDPARSDDW